MFAGVGAGIVVSTLVIALCAAGSDQPRPMWIALGLTAAAGALVADRLLGRVDGTPPPNLARRGRPPLPPEVRRLIVAYACAGFGYVITATYLVLIVRDSDLGQSLEFLTWCVVGACAACSPWLWNRVADRTGDRSALVAAHGVLAARRADHGVRPRHASACWPAAPCSGRRSSASSASGSTSPGACTPLDPTRAIAVMTVAFAVGQMIGPAVGGWLADATGTFRVPSVVAAVVLLAGGAILLLGDRPVSELSAPPPGRTPRRASPRSAGR